MIIFTKHAREKFKILERHGVKLREEQVIKAVESPEHIDHSRLPLLIAQRKLDAKHVLRVVYRQDRTTRTVITFYPGRTSQYEKNV